MMLRPGARPKHFVDHSNPIVLRIGNVDVAGPIHIHRVRTGQLAAQRVSIGAVSPFAGSRHVRHNAGFQVDAANDVILRIGYI